MCKVCWVLVAVLVLLTGGFTYKFIIAGNVIVSVDGRETIEMTAEERELVFSEMRTFLSMVQKITAGIANSDMKSVAEAANKVGRSAQKDMPGSLIGKLPIGFKKLGFDTHSKFSQLALDAEQLGDEQHALAQVSELLENCVACHAIYKIDVELK